MAHSSGLGFLRAPRCSRICGAQWSEVIKIYGNDLSSRSSTLKRGRRRLIKLASSSRRFGLGLGGHELQCRRGRDHAADAGVVPGWPGIGCHPFLIFFALPT